MNHTLANILQQSPSKIQPSKVSFFFIKDFSKTFFKDSLGISASFVPSSNFNSKIDGGNNKSFVKSQNRELKEILIRKENKINKLLEINSVLTKELKQLTDPISEKSMINQKSKEMIHNRDVRIKKLENQLYDSKNKIRNLRSQLSEAKNELTNISKHCYEKNLYEKNQLENFYKTQLQIQAKEIMASLSNDNNFDQISKLTHSLNNFSGRNKILQNGPTNPESFEISNNGQSSRTNNLELSQMQSKEILISGQLSILKFENNKLRENFNNSKKGLVLGHSEIIKEKVSKLEDEVRRLKSENKKLKLKIEMDE